MSEQVIGPNYTETSVPLRAGDRVIFDCRHGLIEHVCPPASQLAAAYSCEETGGVVIIFDDSIRELIPFGTHNIIHKE